MATAITQLASTSAGLDPAAAALSRGDDPVECYRFVVRTASSEMIERATAEMFAALDLADRHAICDRLDQSPEFRAGSDTSPTVERLRHCARRAALAESQSPGALERAVRASGSALDEALAAKVVETFVNTPTARTLLTRSRADAVTSPKASGNPRGGAADSERDPDISDEFGFERGYAGGSGFENVEFDKWI